MARLMLLCQIKAPMMTSLCKRNSILDLTKSDRETETRPVSSIGETPPESRSIMISARRESRESNNVSVDCISTAFSLSHTNTSPTKQRN